MDEQTSWRGHGFTLFVFAGIVFLCAIFFVLGMLVGRTQSLKAAANAPETKKTAASADKPEDKLDFSEDLQKNELPPLIVEPPSKVDTTPEEPSQREPPARENDPSLAASPPLPTPATVLTIQVAALGQSSQASKLVTDLKKLGFERPLIVPPNSGDKPALYRVQVGPYRDAADAASAKKKLEAAGYQPILKK